MNIHRLRKSLLQNSFGLYSFLFFSLFLGLGEFVCRLIPLNTGPLYWNGFDSARYQFERFERYVQLYQAPDCIFFGNSLAQAGIDPDTFGMAFEEKSGKKVQCYNFGMDGSSMSSTVPVAMIIAEKYKPMYIIIGIQDGQFFSHQDISHLAENQFQDDSWVRYKLGHFDLKGWLIDHSALYNDLKYEATWMFAEQSTSPDPVQGDTQIRPEIPRIINDDGFSPLSGYRDSAPIFQFYSDPYKNAVVDPVDFSALKQIIQFGHRSNFHLIFVEMPVYNTSALGKSTVDQVMTYARENGIPFLSTDGLSPLPATAYSDPIHLHISGSKMFSQWLGTQLGEAELMDAYADVHSPVWTPVLITWLKPTYLTNLGMSKSSYSGYQLSVTKFNLFPQDTVLFNPSKEKVDQQFLQSLIGFEIDWKEGITQLDRDNFFQLITILGKMRYQDELMFSQVQNTDLDEWRVTLDPLKLFNLRIDYVVCRVELAYPQKEHCPNGIMNNPDYQLVKSWDFDPLYERYFLFQIVN
jgi:hypothetical protein